MSPAGATGRSPFQAYADARIAAAEGRTADAAAGYRDALIQRPDDVGLAVRAYQAALQAGADVPLAAAARRLDALGMLTGEARLVLLVEAIERDDEAGAARALERLTGPLGFMAPALREWVALGAGQSISANGGRDVASRFAALQRPLIAAARARGGDTGAARNEGIKDLFLLLADEAREMEGSLSLTLARLAWRLAPEDDAAVLALADRLGENGDTAAALALLDADGGSDREARADLATALLVRSGQAEEAVARAAQAAGTAPSLASLARLAWTEGERGGWAASADAYRRTLALPDLAPGDRTRIAMALADVLNRADDWPAARAAFEEAMRLAPDDALLLNNYGYALLVRGEDRARAVAMIEQAARIAPDDPAIKDSLGWARHLQGDPAGAIALIEAAAEARPTDAEIAEHLGDVYWVAGRRRDARYAWTAAATLSDGGNEARLLQKAQIGPG